MKTNPRFILLAASLLALAGCSGGKVQPGQKPDFARGGRIFDVYCAQCHLNADSEAPQMDEAGDWDMRTHEWASIMKDHAKNGFLRMPAKGGQPALSSQNIDDALYYMDIKLRAMQ